MDTNETKASYIAKKVGFLFQNPDRQICQNTVRGEIMFAIENTCGTKEAQEKRAEESMEMFALNGDASPFELSKGERQKVAIASILARKPELLILDEPTTGLDSKEAETVMNAVKNANKNGTTILMITHDMEIAETYANDAIVMSKGRVMSHNKINSEKGNDL
jgi:energy-coupling factor transport system ATP-binding protein